MTLSLIFLTLTASSALSSLFLLCPSSSFTSSASSVFISSNHFALRRQTDHFHLSDQNKNVDAQISGSNSCCSVKHCTTWGRCPSQVDEHKGLPFLPEVLQCRWKTSGFWKLFNEVDSSRIYHGNRGWLCEDLTLHLQVILRAGVDLIRTSFISRYWHTCNNLACIH